MISLNLLVLCIVAVKAVSAQREYSKTKYRKPQEQKEFKLVEEMQIKTPLEAGSELIREVPWLVC